MIDIQFKMILRTALALLLLPMSMAILGCQEPNHLNEADSANASVEPMSVPVVHYDSPYISNPNPKGETPMEEFWEVRLAIYNATQKHGETGPESEADDPRFWVVDDQYNDERYHNMEVYEPEGWTTDWLTDVIKTLRQHEGWAVSVGGIDQGHLLVFADRLMVTGPTFESCNDLESVVAAARLATENYLERKYGPLSRQLEYLKGRLPAAMKEADANGFAYLATFDGFELNEGNAIWILQTRREDEFQLDVEYSSMRSTPVTADATIHPEFCKEFWPYTDVEPPYWLLTYLEEDREITNFEFVDEDGKSMGKLTIGEVIADEEVKRRLSEGEVE